MAEQERRQALLSAARAVFAREGYHRAAIRDIAREAGVATGTFYLYFSSKESCLLGLIDDFYHQMMTEIVTARFRSEAVLDKLAVSVEAVMRGFARNRDLARIVLLQTAGAHTAFGERVARLRGDFARLVQEDLDEAVAQELIPAQNTAVAARALVGSVNEVILAWLQGDFSEDLERAVPALCRFALRGVGGPDGTVRDGGVEGRTWPTRA